MGRVIQQNVGRLASQGLKGGHGREVSRRQHGGGRLFKEIRQRPFRDCISSVLAGCGSRRPRVQHALLQRAPHGGEQARVPREAQIIGSRKVRQ